MRAQLQSIAAVFGGNLEAAEVLCANLKFDDTAVADIAYGLNTSWLITSGALVFIMVGAIR